MTSLVVQRFVVKISQVLLCLTITHFLKFLIALVKFYASSIKVINQLKILQYSFGIILNQSEVQVTLDPKRVTLF